MEGLGREGRPRGQASRRRISPAGSPSATSYGFAGSGNAAFDAYKREQLKRLDEERRKLEDEQKAFRDFVEKVRRAKDQDEFDRFMAERNMPQSS